MSAPTDAGAAARCGVRVAMLSSAIAEMPNDAASNANAAPMPTASMSTPPSAGPARRSATGRTNWSSELACASSAAGRTSGTIASKAGPKNAAPAPYTATSPTTCHSSSMPLIDRAAIRATAHPRERAAHGQGAHQTAGGPAHEARRGHHPRAAEAAGDRAAEQQEPDRRRGHRDAHEGERGRRVGQRVDLPRHRHQEDAVA